MGQSQSTDSRKDTNSTKSHSTENKVDYYELLAVQQGASTDEIRKAYRKKALELHPDKNYGNVEAATKLFAEVQSAYQVLSDPQERAWYDTHRDAFLNIDETSGRTEYCYDSQMSTSEGILKLFSKFSPQMDFSDSPSGFYGGLHRVFTQLALEERIACRSENIEFVDFPTFGTRDDNFDNVVRPFYAIWGSFATKKSFAWRDVYRYSEAPDRRVRRLMEKENKRLRDEGIREFNEAVRSLVAFVKKRDPRYKAGIQSESRRQELLRQTAAAQAARSRAVNKAKLREHVTPDWAKSEVIGEEYSDGSDSEVERFECIVCGKDFKSLNQFSAHERSKKHLKAIKQLRWEMRTESERLKLDQDEIHDKGVPLVQNDGDLTNKPPSILQYSDDRVTDELPGEIHPTLVSSMHDPHKECQPPQIDESDFTCGDIDHSLDKTTCKDVSLESVRIREEDADSTMELLCRQYSASHISDGLQTTPPPKVGKAKQKRARKAARQALEQSANSKCATCHVTFPSRTQLFAHVRKHDHARPQTK